MDTQPLLNESSSDGRRRNFCDRDDSTRRASNSQSQPEWAAKLRQMSTDDLNNLPFMNTTSLDKEADWPESFLQFLSKANSLSLDRAQNVDCAGTGLDATMSRGMNPKKKHEVEWMASLVDKVVTDAKCHLVVDIGSGLGYLDHVLHQVYGHPVLGLETSESHTCAAEARACQQGISCGGVVNRKFNITNGDECFQQLDALIREEAQGLTCLCRHKKTRENEAGEHHWKGTDGEELRVCVIGLHCCGDLSTSMLSLFDRSDHVKALCYVSCCYHKMAYSDHTSPGTFEYFPFSQSGKSQYRQVTQSSPCPPVSPFTLRLGAQETKCRWRSQTEEDHADHTRHVAYRALLEFTSTPSTAMRQRVRKCDFSSFQSFLTSYFPEDKTDDETRRQICDLKRYFCEHKDVFDLIEPWTCLQVIIQPVVESLVYRDRLVWLKERGHFDSRIVPVFDDLISPRNLALVAIKSSG
ncbi:methyltransferase-like protein 25 isoform X2 [Aplysia californica]|uniref:Methyltransferase-like protein 25 isoform X2 n=1 Tax=Aplysia californica TaxID=6500 RepID=A0ABM1W1K1_APLCA|nr:methyltransferase-like protein 25 isoform X2 [Aplysia californica]